MPMLKSQVRGLAQNPEIGESDPKWVENGRQVLRIGPPESYGCSGAFGTGLAETPDQGGAISHLATSSARGGGFSLVGTTARGGILLRNAE